MRLATLAALAGCYTSAAPTPVAEPEPAVVLQPKHARTATDPLGFLPIDSELVMHLDVTKLRRSVLWARFEPQVMARVKPTFDSFQAACGFDVLPMVKRIAVGIRDLDAAKPSVVLVVRGIERDRMSACIAKAVEIERSGSAGPRSDAKRRGEIERSGSAGPRSDAKRRGEIDPKLAIVEGGIVTIHGASGEPPTVIGFADATTFVLLSGQHSSAEHLRFVLDSGSPLRGSETFVDMFTRVDTSRAAWFFLNGNSRMMAAANAVGIKAKALYGSFDLASGLGAKVVLRTGEATEATNFVNLVQAQVGLAKSFAQRFELTVEDADVVLDAQVTDEQALDIANLVFP